MTTESTHKRRSHKYLVSVDRVYREFYEVEARNKVEALVRLTQWFTSEGDEVPGVEVTESEEHLGADLKTMKVRERLDG